MRILARRLRDARSTSGWLSWLRTRPVGGLGSAPVRSTSTAPARVLIASTSASPSTASSPPRRYAPLTASRTSTPQPRIVVRSCPSRCRSCGRCWSRFEDFRANSAASETPGLSLCTGRSSGPLGFEAGSCALTSAVRAPSPTDSSRSRPRHTRPAPAVHEGLEVEGHRHSTAARPERRLPIPRPGELHA